MARTAVFEDHTERYDHWFVRRDVAYQSELAAIRRLMPHHGVGLEIGVGTGRFAAELGIQIGIDPARNMLLKARDRHVHVAGATAEDLPFVDDAKSMIKEAYRVLEPGGMLVVGLIDRDSRLGQTYLAHQSESVFYRDATFYSVSEVETLLSDAGFRNLSWVQTLFKPPSQNPGIEQTHPGYGEGSFVVVMAEGRVVFKRGQ